MVTTLPEGLVFVRGIGRREDNTTDLVTASEWIAGGEICPLIRPLALRLNDVRWWADDAERTEALLPLAYKISGTLSTPEVEAKRCELMAAWLRAELVPMALESAASACVKTNARACATLLRAQAQSVRDGGCFDTAYVAAYGVSAAMSAVARLAPDGDDAIAAYNAAVAAAWTARAAEEANESSAVFSASVPSRYRRPVRDSVMAHIERLCEVKP